LIRRLTVRISLQVPGGDTTNGKPLWLWPVT
jgi:hypothetical protein